MELRLYAVVRSGDRCALAMSRRTRDGAYMTKTCEALQPAPSRRMGIFDDELAACGAFR